MKPSSAGELLHWPRRRRLYRDLHPLWLALYTAFPDICLNPPADPTRPARLPIRDSRGALYRLIIEIHDGLRRLRAHAHGGVLHAAEHRGRRGGEDAAAASVATYISGALWARSAGYQAEHGQAAAAPPSSLLRFSGRDVDVEAGWLADVAAALRNQIVEIHPRHSTTSTRSPGSERAANFGASGSPDDVTHPPPTDTLRHEAGDLSEP